MGYKIEYHKQGKIFQLSGEEFECFVCNKEIENTPKNRVEVFVGKTSYIPETWGICQDCSQLKPKRLKMRKLRRQVNKKGT